MVFKTTGSNIFTAVGTDVTHAFATLPPVLTSLDVAVTGARAFVILFHNPSFLQC